MLRVMRVMRVTHLDQITHVLCVVCSVLCVLNLLDSYIATHIACVALYNSRDRSKVGRSVEVTDEQVSGAFEFGQKGLLRSRCGFQSLTVDHLLSQGTGLSQALLRSGNVQTELLQ
jgi:hypothetical protein